MPLLSFSDHVLWLANYEHRSSLFFCVIVRPFICSSFPFLITNLYCTNSIELLKYRIFSNCSPLSGELKNSLKSKSTSFPSLNSDESQPKRVVMGEALKGHNGKKLSFCPKICRNLISFDSFHWIEENGIKNWFRIGYKNLLAFPPFSSSPSRILSLSLSPPHSPVASNWYYAILCPFLLFPPSILSPKFLSLTLLIALVSWSERRCSNFFFYFDRRKSKELID